MGVSLELQASSQAAQQEPCSYPGISRQACPGGKVKSGNQVSTSAAHSPFQDLGHHCSALSSARQEWHAGEVDAKEGCPAGRFVAGAWVEVALPTAERAPRESGLAGADRLTRRHGAFPRTRPGIGVSTAVTSPRCSQAVLHLDREPLFPLVLWE